MRAETYFANTKWFPFINGAGQEIPSCAVIRVSSVDTAGLFTAAQPNAFGATFRVAVNGPFAVATGNKGMLTFDFPVWVKYDTNDTPAIGASYGPVDAQWYADENSVGFTIIGGTTSGRVLVDRNPDLTVLGKWDSGTTAALATNTMSVFYLASGTMTDTTYNVTSRNIGSVTVSAAKRLVANWHWPSAQWLASAVECE